MKNSQISDISLLKYCGLYGVQLYTKIETFSSNIKDSAFYIGNFQATVCAWTEDMGENTRGRPRMTLLDWT